MKKVLRTIKDNYGKKTPTVVLSQRGGLFRLWQIICFSSQDYNLGNCRCESHPSSEEVPVSTAEIVSRFGVEALDGFDEPGREQIIFNAFGVEAKELERALGLAYWFGFNPLPGLRKGTGNRIVFGEDPDRIAALDKEPGTLFIVNSRGEVSVRVVRRKL